MAIHEQYLQLSKQDQQTILDIRQKGLWGNLVTPAAAGHSSNNGHAVNDPQRSPDQRVQSPGEVTIAPSPATETEITLTPQELEQRIEAALTVIARSEGYTGTSGAEAGKYLDACGDAQLGELPSQLQAEAKERINEQIREA